MARRTVVKRPALAPYPRAKDISGLKRQKERSENGSSLYEGEIRDYFERRRKRLEIAATTTTPFGQTIDWIPINSQPSLKGTKIAEPPGENVLIVTPKGERIDSLARFELEEDKAERGPAGTVPFLRKNLDGLSFRHSLRHLLARYENPGKQLVLMNGHLVPPPSVDGPHRYAFTSQSRLCFGGEGVLSAFDPYCENSDDFSLMQIAVTNSDLGFLQTVEAGWQQRKDSYGDWHPHLFLYYTTNGYTDDDDDVGGYNEDVDGWVQYDDRVHPGALSSPNSTRGGAQFCMQIKFQLYRDNWWFMCNGRWLGYYPARLFMGNKSVFSTLGDHGDRIAFYGEIYDSNDMPGKTRSDMGSGYWPEYGWTWSAYQRNLMVQTSRAGDLDEYDGGLGWASDPDMYDIETHMRSGGTWGSYFWMGGPGA
jgi:hypothetical protein